MTPHGAYTQLHAAASRAHDNIRDALNNIKGLYATGEPPQDEATIKKMVEIIDTLRSIDQPLTAAKDATFDLTKQHLNANKNKIKKPRTLRR